MPLGHRLITAIAICVLLQVVQVSSASAPPRTRTGIDVRCDGDDGLTSRLCDSVDSAFRASQDFTEDSTVQSIQLIITIPTNVNWKNVGRRTRVFYSVELSSANGKLIGKSTGNCFEDKLVNCANQILNKARSITETAHK
jgi:hypothetical protein